MAGESPGRAEQQELSGEATGGGAVDPRLSVFRGVVGAPRGASEPATGDPEFAPEPPEAEGVPEPDRSASATPDDGADVDGGPQDATPDAEDAPPADGAGDDAESRTDDAVAEEAGTGESGTDGDEDGAGDEAEAEVGTEDGPQDLTEEDGTEEDRTEDEASGDGAEDEASGDGAAEPSAGGTPVKEPEDAVDAEDAVEPEDSEESADSGAEAEEPSAAGETGRGEGPSAGTDERTGADAEAESGDDGAGDAGEEAPDDSAEDAPGESRDATPSDGHGDDGGEGPSQGPGDVKVGPGARDASGGGHGGPRAGEGTLTLRAPRTEGGGTPVRDRTLTLRAPSASAPVATPSRPSGTFVPLRTDDRPAVVPQAPAPVETARTTEPGGGSRTKQMPLPPDPDEPLRLLAELTNTPPPPQTPLRTTVRRIKIWTPLVLLLIVAFCVAQALRPLPEPELDLTAETSYTFKGDELALPWPSEGQAVVEAEGLGRMGEFGEQVPTPIASVAKVMTTYVILRDHPIKKGGKGETVEVDQKAEDQYHSGMQESESVVPVTAGQKLSEYEALEAVMLPSANNIARLLARWDAGSEEAFVKKMNAAAKELGMDDTTYTDPSGLEATTVSTASDQVKLGHAAMQDEVFAEIATKIQYTDINGADQKNYNQLAGYHDIVGIKTGTSTKAGGNLLFAAYRTIGGTKQLIVGAMLDQQKAPIIDTVLSRSRTLIDGTRDALASAAIIKKGDVVGYVDDGLGGRTPVVAGKDVTAIGWTGLKVDISVETGKGGLPHAAQAGDQVGELVVGKGDSVIRVPVVLESALVEPSFGSKLTRVA
ncbi:D-alanyl-D-alanine carboxypeptidase [Streptomyces sp. NPDC059718]